MLFLSSEPPPYSQFNRNHNEIPFLQYRGYSQRGIKPDFRSKTDPNRELKHGIVPALTPNGLLILGFSLPYSIVPSEYFIDRTCLRFTDISGPSAESVRKYFTCRPVRSSTLTDNSFPSFILMTSCPEIHGWIYNNKTINESLFITVYQVSGR